MATTITGTSVTSDGLVTNTLGTSNLRLGVNAGDSITSGGNYNTVVGDEAGTAITTGDGNTAVGYAALDANTTANDNTAVGYSALTANTTGTRNTAVGESALVSNTTGVYNSATGYRTLYYNTTADSNTGYGMQALYQNTTGASNTAVGESALYNNTTAANNTAVGQASLANNTTGANNVAVGKAALYANTTGADNTAVGYDSLGANTTGGQNTAIGREAGNAITTGAENTFVGYKAGNYLIPTTTGTENTIIGAYSHASGAAVGGEIVLGRFVRGIATGYFTFGNGNGSSRVYNNFLANASWTRVSDERVKKDISTNTDCGLDFINDLRTVTYKFKAPSELDTSMSEYDSEKTTPKHSEKMYGFVAQEVKAVLDAHNITDFAGHHQIEDGEDNMQGISYEMFVMPLVKAIQELSTQNAALAARLTALEA